MTTPPPISVAADDLGGHPAHEGTLMDGSLSVDGGRLAFTTRILEGVTFVPWSLEIPLGSIVGVSWADRAGLERLRPYVWHSGLARWFGDAAFTPRTVRDRLLLVGIEDGAIASFSLAATDVQAIITAASALRGEALPEILPRQVADPALAEIRDLLVRQTELLERIAEQLGV